MDLRTLRYFTVAAQELNITRAAQKLHMSQPPLSHQLRLLEEELGAPLFVRGKRRLQLTEEGAALLRRANAAPQQKQQPSLLTAGGITLDPEQRVAMKNGEIIELTAKEYDLIELLVRNPRRIYSRENLMDLVWGYTYAGDYRTVDVHIRRLREKLEDNPAAPQHILTKWGVGYYLKD